MRTIDADALTEVLETMAKDEWNQQVGSSKGLEDAIDVIENAPTVEPCYQTSSCSDCKNYDKENHNCPRYCEVIEEALTAIKSRPKGKWEFSINHTTPKYPWGMYRCSNCNNWNGLRVRFCPNCGADMQETS